MKYVERIYSFNGEWDVPSRCGLSIIRRPDIHIVIVTELYEENPGTSVTACAPSLAAQIVGKFGLDPEKLLYIEQSPDRGSKLAHY
ncbi:MAG: class I SAM-dependent methyltransferase, partial [Chrysiogenales bacterium]